MPKIIENAKEQLLHEAKRQICENGYAKTTIRSVASACGLGVGTVYNYFGSKDMLIASLMLEDWQRCLSEMISPKEEGSEEALRRVFLSLSSFTETYSSLFCDRDAAKVFATASAERHSLLRKQLADVIKPLCKHSDSPFLAEFIAESLLTWTLSGKSFPEIYSVVKLLLEK